MLVLWSSFPVLILPHPHVGIPVKKGNVWFVRLFFKSTGSIVKDPSIPGSGLRWMHVKSVEALSPHLAWYGTLESGFLVNCRASQLIEIRWHCAV
ncbi:hypothetical protein TNCV_3000101 [Trichonephila clavipes]|nr:hypothetical protein TNCV_3000101 [Trichonephila clavipes]